MRNIFLLILFVLTSVPFANAQQPAQFKTAKQAQQEDSVYQAAHPAVKDTLPPLQYENPKDTAAWGALVTLGLVFVIPQGELADITLQGPGYGFQTSVLINPAKRRNPFAWERRMANIYGGVGVGYMKQGGIKDVLGLNDNVVSSTITNSMWAFDLIGRAEILKGPIKLFVEGNWGGSLFAAKQELEFASSSPTNINVSQTTGASSEWLGHYAYGGGVRTGTELFKLEFKFMNHIGQSVSYINLATTTYDPATKTLNYSTHKVNTNFWLPQVAASYLF